LPGRQLAKKRDLLTAACNQLHYEDFRARGPHANCAENPRIGLKRGVKELQHSGRFSNPNTSFSETIQTLESTASLICSEFDWLPGPVNFFLNRPVEALKDGVGCTLSIAPPVCPPGGYVALRAERECVVIVSACPMDMVEGTGMRLRAPSLKSSLPSLGNKVVGEEIEMRHVLNFCQASVLLHSTDLLSLGAVISCIIYPDMNKKASTASPHCGKSHPPGN